MVGLAVVVGVCCLFFGKQAPMDQVFMAEILVDGCLHGTPDLGPLLARASPMGITRLCTQRGAIQLHQATLGGAQEQGEMELVGFDRAIEVVAFVVAGLPAAQ
jgi:hypothetical protein